MACTALTAPTLRALDVTFNTASEVPVTAASYSASGEVNFTLGFAPSVGTNLTVVKNTGLRFITGLFSNLPNGTRVNLTHNGITYPFVAWYYGGEGNNDLMLLWPYTGLAAWGKSSRGQLGDGDRSAVDRLVPIRVDQTGVLLGKTIVQIARGHDHSLALCSDGTVVAWGYNEYGQLGNNSTEASFIPVPVNAAAGTSVLAGKTVVSIAAGYAHSLAICSDGTVAAWGDNLSGQLGDNSTTSRFVPVTVNRENGLNPLFGKTVVAIAAGGFHSLALCSDGTLAAWGRNVSGEVGDGHQVNRKIPVEVNREAGDSALAGKTVKAIAAGIYHSLALCSDGTLAAWGSDAFEQLGNNNVTVWSDTPANVNRTGKSALAGRTVVGIAAGYSHSLALCSDGTVAAWGSDYYGEIGDNDPRPLGHTPTPGVVNATAGISALAGKTVVAIVAGFAHNLALCSDGTLAAWGANVDGQLGDNSTTSRYAPVAVSMAGGTSAFAGQRASLLSTSPASYHSIAAYGTTPAEIGVEVLEPAPTDLTDHVSTVDFGSGIAAGRTFRVRNAGGLPLANLSARLTGSGAASFTLVNQPLPVIPVDGVTTFHLAFSGEAHGIQNAMLEIVSNDHDEPTFQIALVGTKLARLTAGFSAVTDTPITAPSVNLTGVEVDLTLGFVPTAGTNLTVIKNTGPAFITGQFSNLPNGATVNLSHEGTIYPFVAWYYGGAGNNDLMLLWPHTGLAAWGENTKGQLGDNYTKSRSVPGGVVQSGVLLGKTIVQVVRGRSHSLALCSDGTVASWGANNNGQLGDNSAADRLVPVAVNVVPGTSALAGKTVVAIAAGNSHSLALCSDGTVAAWGWNLYGTLGDNSRTDRLVPVAVNGDIGVSALAGKIVTAIAAGGIHSLALCSDGTVAAWGDNNFDQLGINYSSVPYVVPMAVNVAAGISALAGKTVVSIAAGDIHSLALCSDGTLVSWGWNHRGQLGVNSNGGAQTNIPVKVNVESGISALAGKTVVAIAAGYAHTMALCSDGMVAAWGDNTFGQLGHNSKEERFGAAVAVDMSSVTSALSGKTVIAIGAGTFHCLALCSDGTLAAWGDNSFGQLGDNSTLDRRIPVMVNRGAGKSVLAGRPVSQLSVGPKADHNIAIYGLIAAAAPEIAVTGNGLDIPHGDTTPGASDFTDFGSTTLINAQVSHSFTIFNEGNISLNLSARPLVTLDGLGADAFAVTREPYHAVAPGGSTSFTITFDPTLPGPHTATVTIQSDAVNHPAKTFCIQGFGARGTLTRAQAITFAPPPMVYLGQSPLDLSARASSGLPVTLSVVPTGTTAAGVVLVGNTLNFTSAGTVKVQAVQVGDDFYAAALPVMKTITVKASPSALTLLNLAQTYTGTPCNISYTGGAGAVKVEYKVSTAFGPAAPTNAGSYPVRATDSTGTKTGTLIIAKAPLYVTPDDKSKFVGENNPALTVSYRGWVNGESEGLVTHVPVLRTTATKASVGGVHPITASGGVAPVNYVFIYQQGMLVVDSFAATYETLVTNQRGWLFGKLVVTVTETNSSFTGKLLFTEMPFALSLKGPLVTNPDTESATGNATALSPYSQIIVSITVEIGGSITASITNLDGSAFGSGAGRRLLKLAAGKTVAYSGAHTAVLEPATPAEIIVSGGNSWANLPRGAGWATAVVSNKGVMTLTGRLGDGTPFTSSLTPNDESDPVYRLFVQPYKTGSATHTGSCLAGALTLLPLPTPSPALARRRYVEAAVLNWIKSGWETDVSYPSGFFGTDGYADIYRPSHPLSTVMMLDPWLPPATGISLAARLGLTNSSFQVLHSVTGSSLNGNLPTLAGLSTTNLVSVTTPSANATKWKTTLVPATGMFSGSFELADTTPKPRAVTFSGVLRQPATAPDSLIGDGHYELPPTTGTEKTTGEVMFLRP
jgi:alpha-tubulin suppressor-like RCC1 family protein